MLVELNHTRSLEPLISPDSYRDYIFKNFLLLFCYPLSVRECKGRDLFVNHQTLFQIYFLKSARLTHLFYLSKNCYTHPVSVKGVQRYNSIPTQTNHFWFIFRNKTLKQFHTSKKYAESRYSKHFQDDGTFKTNTSFCDGIHTLLFVSCHFQ
jgi:hypothetical protein